MPSGNPDNRSLEVFMPLNGRTFRRGIWMDLDSLWRVGSNHFAESKKNLIFTFDNNRFWRFGLLPADQGCQMAHFQTKSTNLGKFWRVLQWTMLVYFIAI
jgi:hypothetical protein